MRIDMVSEHASPLAALGEADAGGQNVHVAALARTLGSLGHEVRVYTRRDDPDAAERVPLSPGVSVVHVPAGPARPVPKDDLLPHMDELGRWMARDWRRHGRPDVVHAHFWMSGLAALGAARGSSVPLVQTFHALGTVKRRHQGCADTSPAARVELETRIAREVDLVVATCRDEVAELAAMGLDRAGVVVVPCGVDTRRFTPAGPRAAAARPRLLLVGRMVPRKGFDDAVRALAHLPGVELVVAGGPPRERLEQDPEAERLRTLARESGVADRLLLWGQVEHDAMPAVYRSADIVLAVPWYEPFGITPLEAAASGRPVVGAAVGGLLDSVQDGVTGTLVPPRDPEAIARAVAQLLDDPDRAEAMGRAARQRAVERFDWSTVAAQTFAAYQRVVAARHKGVSAPPATAPVGCEWLDAHVREVARAMESLCAQGDVLRRWGDHLATALSAGSRVLVAGNGGSAAEAQHLTAELVGRFREDRRPFSALALTAETSSLTAILNDYGPDEVFARQVEAHGRPGDVLVLLSTSGSSSNVLHAAKRARDLGLVVWGMTGPAPNPLAALCDAVVAVDAPSTAAVQEAHLMAVHGLCAVFDQALTRPARASDETATSPALATPGAAARR
ncbi:glycosyltransferase [Phycicoccus sp. 3266]|jgi:type III pantothenate kinase|uniref:glycosyltransferase n=1 Tax=Phycicoccus sp. 3266 TaxID=2817751 RepID=UPI0028661314|nr:glycosyltransferase [Phycicoccus sp. 3266]MDR6864740.1 type III pantothenate kinase [Phycicoccus sp. 3266]